MQYKLISIISIPVTLRMFPKTTNGRTSYNHYIRLEPGKVYETDDPAQIEYLKGHKEKVRYRPELEKSLKEIGAEYEVIMCKSCGGRVKKIEYRNVEVIADE